MTASLDGGTSTYFQVLVGIALWAVASALVDWLLTRADILLGKATYPLVKDAVVAGPLETFSVKGARDPASSRQLGTVDPAAAGVARRLDGPLVQDPAEVLHHGRGGVGNSKRAHGGLIDRRPARVERPGREEPR